ncbi:NAD(P)/FAD-dependent oxidoreductase [Candidatus Solincola tengchongensis]|uniref:NAD(P)/FAD-dependent oxidoreductase n=1 Tax=Candidatus Solincola tengchongensis TaxID=2900693 RepID=UPI00257A26E8|nr:NAD(P)/FAD-dependent oxidoreductase [Candidatus Solincola tengchongensis]
MRGGKPDEMDREPIREKLEPRLPARAQAVVVGAGVIGCAVAREITRYTPDVVVLDKENDVACGASKANNAEVHSGIGEEAGTLKQRLNVRGNHMYEGFVQGLGVEFKRQGLLIVVTPRSVPPEVAESMNPQQLDELLRVKIPEGIVAYGEAAGIRGLRILSREEVLKKEPNVTPEAVSGVFDPNYGLVCPYKLTIALAEHAVMNGARFLLNTEVTGFRVEGDEVRGVITSRGEIATPLVINAAGVFADEVAEMAGAGGFRIHPRKGATLLFDRQVTSEYVRSSVALFRMPGMKKERSKGGGAMPTVEGNLQLGPTAVEVDDKYDTSISAEEIEEIFERFHYLLPDFPKDAVISAFSGVRAPTYEEDFVIEASNRVKGFVNVAGIQSPGLASAPAIVEMVMGFLHELGIPREPRPDFRHVRPATPRFAELDDQERDALIRKDPRWGNIICRCEYVTEAEVLAAIHSLIPATDMDGVKRRTRTGMGRCQGGFCGHRVAAILARELGRPVTEITKSGEGSPVYLAETKDFLRAERSGHGQG